MQYFSGLHGDLVKWACRIIHTPARNRPELATEWQLLSFLLALGMQDIFMANRGRMMHSVGHQSIHNNGFMISIQFDSQNIYNNNHNHKHRAPKLAKLSNFCRLHNACWSLKADVIRPLNFTSTYLTWSL